MPAAEIGRDREMGWNVAMHNFNARETATIGDVLKANLLPTQWSHGWSY